MRTASRLTLVMALLGFASSSCAVDGARALSGSHAAEGKAIVVQNFYYALPGKADEVYRWRLHASEIRAQLGFAVGRVLRRAAQASADQAEDDDLPDVVWECEYPNAKARAAEVARLDASGQFGPVEAHMQTLIRRFHRAVFTVTASE